MVSNEKINMIARRGISFILDEAILFIPIFIITMFIEMQLVSISVLEYIEFSPLMYIYSYPLPSLMFWLQITDIIAKTNSIHVIESLFFIIMPIVLKIIILTYFESSGQQGSIGKKSNKICIVNKDGTKIKPFKTLVRNIIKYVFIAIFPVLTIFTLHDIITRTKVVPKD